MTSPLQSLIATGTKLWLDSVDPELVTRHRQLGATGATSNPIIIADLLKSGRFDARIASLLARQRTTDHDLAWNLTDQIVSQAEEVFLDVWQETRGDNGYVSFEIDPLLEDPDAEMTELMRIDQYIALGKQWREGHPNRMIKVPATPAGLQSLEALAAAGVPLNVTLIFTLAQYVAARDAIWRGAQQLESLDRFKSVYSIFVSRLDVYTEQHLPQLSPQSQGMVGIVNAKRIWQANQKFWKAHPVPLAQEIVFASTGTKQRDDPPWKYVEALAGSDIQTNPPATNEAVEQSGRSFSRQVDRLPDAEVLAEIDRVVDMGHLHDTLMEEGLRKFADPQWALLKLIGDKRAAMSDR